MHDDLGAMDFPGDEPKVWISTGAVKAIGHPSHVGGAPSPASQVLGVSTGARHENPGVTGTIRAVLPLR